MTSSSTTTATVKGREDSKTKLRSVKSVAVVGGGISGLAAAYKLKSNGLDVTLFEADEIVDGKLKSVSRDGLIWDEGANTMIVGKKARNAFVIFNDIGSFGDEIGHEVCNSLLAALASDGYVDFAKKMFDEMFVRENVVSLEASNEDSKRSVRDFFERHFGKEVVDYLIDPFVAHTSAADLDSLSSLANMLCKELGDSFKLNSKVLSLSCSLDENSLFDNWSISYATNHKKPSPYQSFDAVIMTVNYMPLSVVITTYKKENVRRPLEGFGVLIPSIEQQTNGYKTLGTIFSSMMFPDRVPSDVHLYTTFVGGSRNKELAKASVYVILYACEWVILHAWHLDGIGSPLILFLFLRGYCSKIRLFLFGAKLFPCMGMTTTRSRAIEKMEESLPGFFYAGNHRGGLSVDKALATDAKR
ncbi:hypothetical protein IFM89_021812 [Coptis chinensis]|uniref:Amine oxidase domain-containing protein n=1 Tax=Coptis chinensis TaxID=261450 RepID=A0A835HNR1_9MAGN|nr:hypothetical protein IFM89_021812 [Coptis chinensis]